MPNRSSHASNTAGAKAFCFFFSKKKAFFFEKKKQKTFAPLRGAA
jgi:hypothetical protein